MKFGNLQSNEMLDKLIQTYPSHNFTINMEEASGLCKSVRLTDRLEESLIELQIQKGHTCIHIPNLNMKPVMKNLTKEFANLKK